jgi:Xaa-Pro aminopeptidase
VLRDREGSGPILLLGHRSLPRNYPDNVFPFRQNSHVLYYCGISRPDVALVLASEGDVLFGPPEDIDDVVWHGPHETLEDAARKAGIEDVRPIGDLPGFLRGCGSSLRYIAPYQANVVNWLAGMLRRTQEEVRTGASREVARAVTDQRSVKEALEIAEIEDALAVTAEMHRAGMAKTRPGATEAQVAAAVQAVALAHDRAQAYNPIVTVRGEVLHNNDYGNTLEAGQLLLNDSGAESPLYYASDITRTAPVSGTFDAPQREMYEIVLASQLAAIDAVRPGVAYRDVHLVAAKTIARGLTDAGLMKGDPEEAVAAGAHALFFPHGIGHMLGLDVHDMEDLGDVVGYGGEGERSDQFGLNFLRLARPLQPGFVVTVEPGLYFIPALIERWRGERRHEAYIAYEQLERFRNFGGIRIEDDVQCTDTGHRVLGPGIPKGVAEVEAVMAS